MTEHDTLQEQLARAAKQKENEMSDEQDKKLKVTLKLGPQQDFYIFQADSPEELAKDLEDFAESADRIFDAQVKISQVIMAKGLVKTGPSASASTGQNSAPAKSAAGAGQLSCDHGALKVNPPKRRDGGNYVYEYSCPSYKCKPTEIPNNPKR